MESDRAFFPRGKERITTRGRYRRPHPRSREGVSGPREDLKIVSCHDRHGDPEEIDGLALPRVAMRKVRVSIQAMAGSGAERSR